MMAVAGIACLLILMNAAEPDSADRRERVEKAFNELNVDNTVVLSEFYSESVIFEDPLVRIEGLEALKKYYTEIYASVDQISFVFHRHVTQDNSHVATWTMHLSAKKLKKGEEIVANGSSVLEFDADGKVVYHRDYFDMGEMVYRHVPVLRFFVRKVDRRLTSDIDPEQVKNSKHSDRSVEERK